jgi:anti-anti-sigma factor
MLTLARSGGLTAGQRTLDLLMMMEISHKEFTPGIVVVALAGKVMMGVESEQILGVVDNLLREGKRTIVFDVAGVKHIDSTGIGRFISSYHKISAAGGEMRMAGAAGVLFQAFHVCMLDTVFKFYPDVEEACKM